MMQNEQRSRKPRIFVLPCGKTHLKLWKRVGYPVESLWKACGICGENDSKE